jgi:hypothetical protein
MAVEVDEGAGAWQELAARRQSNDRMPRAAMLIGSDLPGIRIMAFE